MDEKERSTQQNKSLGRGPVHMMRGVMEKPKDLKGSLKKLWTYLKVYKSAFFVVILFAVISTIFSILSPKILGNITDDIVSDYLKIRVYDEIMAQIPEGTPIPEDTTAKDLLKFFPKEITDQIPQKMLDKIGEIDLSEKPSINFDKVLESVYFLIGLYLLGMIFSYLQGWIMTGITQKLTYQLRKEISEKINRLPLKYFDTRTHGEVLSRITNDVDTVGQSLNQSLTQIITSITSIIGIIYMMLTINFNMTLISLIVIPLSMLFVVVIVKKSQPLFKQQQESLGEINGHIEEMYSGHYVVKAFNGEERSIEKFNEINDDLYKSAWKSQFLSGLMMPVMRFIGNIGYVAISVIGGSYAIQGKISIGGIQAFIQYVNSLNRPIVNTATMANILQSTAAAAERVFEFLDGKEEIPDVDDPILLGKVEGQVKFNNVIFGYEPEKPVIKGFSADIKPGQKVAIVGPTGAGKTTMVNLLMRFYDVDKGSIQIDGIDIRSFRRSDLRRLFGMVLQDTWLFNGTIKENLKYGNPDATNREVRQAAKAAHVHNFVNSLPNGYKMMINEETDNISQGEKQLLTIARAMLADPPMLILDEATSSVDTRTEVAIQKAMDNLMKGRTSFVIAHRLSTIRNADLILVMNKGNIVEQGRHDELLASKGFYYDLYNSQFNGRH